MADWIAPKSAAEPLESSLTPWSSARPLYEIVAVTPGARLPSEDRGTALQWAPGALDGVLAHHAGRGGQSTMKQVLDCLRAVLGQSTNANMRALWETLADSRVLDYIDQLLPAIEAEFPSDRMRLAGLGRFLAFRAPLREPVKFGIALLGITGDESDLKPLLQLAQCEEFTLFASVAIWNLTPDSERYLWDLAKRLSGWGRIHVVERLAQTQNREIQAWLLREGFRNGIDDECLACICARAGKLHEALRAREIDATLLDSAGDLLLALIRGGPAEDMADYEDAPEAIERYTHAVWKLAAFTPKQFVIVDRILEWIRSNPAWTPPNRQRCLILAQQLLDKQEWKAAVERDLLSLDEKSFQWANAAAKRLGIDAWQVLFARVQADPLSSRYWGELTEATDGSRIDPVLAFVEGVLPLDASGHAGLEPTGVLGWMLQLLDRFPCRGWKLLRTGLQSSAVSNRSWAFRAFYRWPLTAWPPDALRVLRSAAKVETASGMKKAMDELLRRYDPAHEPETPDTSG